MVVFIYSKLGRDKINMYKHGGYVYENKDIIDFSANINPFGMPKGVIRAAWEGVVHSNQYPDPYCTSLRCAISRDRNIPENFILCGNGAADLIFSLALALKPRKALIAIPTFYEYEQALKTVGCEIAYFVMEEEQEFSLQEVFLTKIEKDLDIIFLCNPNNPTGNIIKKSFLQRVIQECEKKDIWLIVDECFMDFVEDGAKDSVMDEIITSSRLFVLKAFTKLYAMPGLRLGYGISSNLELMKCVKEVLQPWNVSLPAQRAGVAALKEKEYVDESLKMIRKEKKYLIEELHNMKIKTYGSHANYIFFQANSGLYEACLRRGFMIRDCSNYPGLRDGFYRIAVKRQEDNEALMKALKEVVEWQNQL